MRGYGAARFVGTLGLLLLSCSACAPKAEQLWSTQLIGTVLQAPWPDGKGWIVGHGAGVTLLDQQGQVRCQLSNVGGVLGGAIAHSDWIYFGSNNHYVYAIDGQCHVKWRVAVGGPVAARPALADDKLLITTATGLLWALHAVDGQVQWRFPALPTLAARSQLEFENKSAPSAPAPVESDWSAEESKIEPLPSKGKSVNRRKGKGTGKRGTAELLRQPSEAPLVARPEPAPAKVRTPILSPATVGPFWSSEPVSDGQLIWIGNGDGTIYGFGLQDGTIKARFRSEQGIGASSVMDEEALYIGSYDGYLYRLRKPNLQLSWKLATDDMLVAAGWLTRDSVIVGSMDGWLRAVNSRDGQLRWRVDLGAPIASKVVVRQGLLFAATAGKPSQLVLLGLMDGVMRWHLPLPEPIRAGLQLQGDTLLVASQSGSITAYQVGALLRHYGIQE